MLNFLGKVTNDRKKESNVKKFNYSSKWQPGMTKQQNFVEDTFKLGHGKS